MSDEAAKKMWCEAILWALWDIDNEKTYSTENNQRRQDHNKRSAITWIKSKDFELVCDCLGIDFESIRKKALS
jgi:hypothetical protein